MKFVHQIVTKEERNVTQTETIYTNCNKPKFSMKCLLQIMKDVQYEIVNMETSEITIVTL